IAFVYSRNIIYRDISCNNVFLNKELNAKLSDFAGSLINDKAPLIYYKTSYKHPNNKGVSIRSKVFALSSTFYKVIIGSKLYKELLDEAICNVYARGEFLSLAFLAAFRDIIAKCWA
ncbi:uncharacterized protein K441DRAFT_536216, partial [Cenococcum geophilum 1.58]|uniref:uncharacterized protein n=1 Tax=Cenococcum geophilum 1.58 TaxID=794803 RepID=UPI00358FA70C